MPAQTTPPDPLERYSRQVRYPAIGEEGQRRLMASRALICGCGALGTVLANTLARAGVGFLRIVDRDFVELTNLQRQVLFDERDLAEQLPKAVAAARKLRGINSQVEIDERVVDVTPNNIESLAGDVDIILDGTDNFETRFLINDFAVKHRKPWIYGGCLGAEGQSLTIVPGQTPCLRCLIAEPPPPGTSPTCDTAGILGSIINIIASIQACEAIKILSGHVEAINPFWTIIGLWDNSVRQIEVRSLRPDGNVDNGDNGGGGCATCRDHEFPWLSGNRMSHTAVLCGRNAVQVSVPREPLNLESFAANLSGVGKVTRTPFFLRLVVDTYTLTIFPDGRAIIAGTDDVSLAKTLYARYVGS